MIEDFEFYIRNNLVKKVISNKETSIGLMERANARLNYVKDQRIDRNTAPFIFEDIYEILREATQSLMELKGYKPYSHEANISFLKKFYKFSQYSLATFDRLRILRNKCIYGAAQISPDTCKEALGFAITFLPEIKKEFDKEPK